jgi:hypothetical protein
MLKPKFTTMLEITRNAASLLVCILREIFDENSYARFLARAGRASSAEAYAEFVHQEAHLRERRPRCC